MFPFQWLIGRISTYWDTLWPENTLRTAILETKCFITGLIRHFRSSWAPPLDSCRSVMTCHCGKQGYRMLLSYLCKQFQPFRGCFRNSRRVLWLLHRHICSSHGPAWFRGYKIQDVSSLAKKLVLGIGDKARTDLVAAIKWSAASPVGDTVLHACYTTKAQRRRNTWRKISSNLEALTWQRGE